MVKEINYKDHLGGIMEMKKIPDLVFIIDTNYESLAIKESIKLGISNYCNIRYKF